MTSDLTFYLIVNWSFVNKKLKKYPADIKTKIKRDITLLKYNPRSGTMIDVSKQSSLWKKRYQEVEIYYTIENFAVVVLDIKYIGTVELVDIVSGIKSGRHNNMTTTKQQRIIKNQKKKFNG